MDGVEHRGCHHADRRLTDAAPEIVARYDDRLDLRHFGKPHDRVAVEVQIHHPSVPDPALPVERRGEPIGYRSFDLCGDLARIDGVSAIERQHYAVNIELAAGAYRMLTNRSLVAVL